MNSRMRIRRLANVALLAIVAVAVSSSNAMATDVDLYAKILSQHTRSVRKTVGTQVDYHGLRESAAWPRLVETLRGTKLAQLRSSAENKAFWINAYNILAIDRVIVGKPERSIRDLGSFFQSVWKKPAGAIDGKPVTLDQIEHEILRPMGDPRIHAAIVCASTSCPSLLREPWVADRMDDQFDRAIRAWLADENKGASIDRAANRIRLSSIFKWFADDFAAGGGVVRFVAGYLEDSDASWLRDNADTVDVGYLDYDWTLNQYRAP